MFRVLFFFISISLTVQNSTAQPAITLEDIFSKGRFYQKSVDGIISMNDGKHFSLLENNRSVSAFSYASGVKTIELFSLDNYSIDSVSEITSYEFDNSELNMLITTDRDYIYRHSFVAYNYIFDIKQGKLIEVSNEKLQMAKISPNGKYVAFVLGNNIYIKDLSTLVTHQITFDGRHGNVINGMADWVYEEEFALTSGFFWSPDSKFLAFYRFDESRVKEFQIEEYTGLYPERFTYKYPKAGEENSVVEIRVLHVESGNVQTIATGEETDVYYPRVKWTGHFGKLCVVRLSRLQNKADLLLCDALSGVSEIFYTETDAKYISQFTDDFACFMPYSGEVIILSGKDGYMHLYRYNLSGEPINQVTHGNWEVDKVLAIDPLKKVVYFTSTEESPLERHVYRVSFDGANKKKISSGKGSNSAVFSRTFEYYILSHSASDMPLEVSVFDSTNRRLRILEDNTVLKKSTSDYQFAEQEFFSFTGPGNNILYGYMYKPHGFDPGKKYPLLMYVYGGPESQEVLNEWNQRQAWFQYLCQNGYMVACVDNRGTNGRGEGFKKATYMQLGKLETDDQLAAARHLALLPYVDNGRIGIFGWSYGGYMSLLCLMKGNGLFKAGIAVAPVTSWRFYDTAYTERFMRRPQDNSGGYDLNSPLHNVDGLKGKLLLVHGTSDDNVHLQNSMMLANELVKQNKPFEMQIYPNKNHGIYGGNTRLHLYTRMSSFIFNNL
ncbi:MAG: DPP IV N-terminal domain-containing protein [Bacteroidales bacterium]|nr:DPP IV N-terminal domain-containing protein [Bacteroidales bacterium]